MIIFKMVDAAIKFAVVCSSNQNRSMEAHNFLSKRGYRVKSFGTGSQVKLPGPAPDRPNIYDFNTTYDEMYNDLAEKNPALYTQNGILHMLDRNRRIKPKPERFQSSAERFNVIITCEERVYDQVIDDLENRLKDQNEPVHIVNLDIQDNHEEATIGALMICDLAGMLVESDDLDNDMDEIIQDFETTAQRPILHTVIFY
ncbi:RNA polymerase II subunit A C-terminal domain phosphatase SSU72-like [Argopecten irradians]|uniref:RNA polymerase II subunit A C-terminal domain phosphatase SSU72-like n=1 Tax=Argopecten irradians TaxID=31199 RepID=UPI003724BF13